MRFLVPNHILAPADIPLDINPKSEDQVQHQGGAHAYE